MSTPDPRINFIVQAESDARLQELCHMNVDRDWRSLSDGENTWSLQTFHRLREAGRDPTCSRHLLPDRINFAHAAYLRAIDTPRDAFVVCLQADFPRVPWADLRVVQNQCQVRGDAARWIPHWPQPGLVARKPNRTTVHCVAHAGRSWMLAGTRASWDEALRKIGCEFKHLGPEKWNDLSEVDVLLAIRSFDRRIYKTKPPSKLLNAWIAGIPLVAGHDSAFSQIGTPGKDYFRVASLVEACDAIRHLKEDPSLYRDMVERGRKRAEEYSKDRIVERWIHFIDSQVIPRYEHWLNGGRTRGLLWECRVVRARVSRLIQGKLRKFSQAVMGKETVNRIRLRFR